MKKLVLILTLMLCGRSMTLAFIGRAGGPNQGDPPIAWLMPLIGDAVIGITGLLIAYLIVKKTGLWVWTTIIVWNALSIWDALSAFIIHNTNPWPDFFMIQIMGGSMFFAASIMHAVIIYLMTRTEIKRHFINSP